MKGTGIGAVMHIRAPRAIERSSHMMTNPFGPLYSFDFIVLLICAVGFYRLADLDPEASPIVWACLSAGMFFVTWRLLRWGLAGDLFGQAVLVGGITAVRILRSRRGPP